MAIVSGVQEALDLVARLFLNPGDRVAMEDPGYPGAALVYALGARIAAVPVDEQGMTLRSARLQGARLVYVTPAHQFPLGVTMSLPRRMELLEWARKSGGLIFEDDYDSEYRYSGRPVPALQGLDRDGRVLFAGSFSKVLFPSLRLGYLVIPSDLLGYFAATRSLTSRHAPLLEQAVLCDFMGGGHFGRHLRRMREAYAERLSVLLDAAQQELAGLLEVSSVEAGLQTSAWLRAGIDGESAARAAAARDVEVIPPSRYSRGRMAREGLQLGFAAVDVDEIRRGVRDLAVALETSRETTGSEEGSMASRRVRGSRLPVFRGVMDPEGQRQEHATSRRGTPCSAAVAIDRRRPGTEGAVLRVWIRAWRDELPPAAAWLAARRSRARAQEMIGTAATQGAGGRTAACLSASRTTVTRPISIPAVNLTKLRQL